MRITIQFVQKDGTLWPKKYCYKVVGGQGDLVRKAGVGGTLYSESHDKPIHILEFSHGGLGLKHIGLRECTEKELADVGLLKKPEPAQAGGYTVRANVSVPGKDGVCRQQMGVLVHPMYEEFLQRAMQNHTLVMCEGQKVYIMSLSRTIGGYKSYDRARYPHFEQIKEAGCERPVYELNGEEPTISLSEPPLPQLQIDLKAGRAQVRVWAPMDWHDWFKDRIGKEVSFGFYEDPKQYIHRAKVDNVSIGPMDATRGRIRPVASSTLHTPPDGPAPEQACDMLLMKREELDSQIHSFMTEKRVGLHDLFSQDKSTTVSLNTQSQQEKTVNSKIKIENITFINGKPVDQHTVEDVVALIERSNAAIEKMEAFTGKVPSETVKELLSREKHVRDQLVTLLDSGQLKES